MIWDHVNHLFFYFVLFSVVIMKAYFVILRL